MSSITVYPDPHPETSTVDGEVHYNAGGGTTWNTVRTSTGNNFSDSATTETVCTITSIAAGWHEIRRGVFLFDTSAIGDTDTIDSATFSVFVDGKYNATYTDSFAVVASSPASNTGLAGGDYNTMGSTRFATDISFASMSTVAYNDYALNASGLAAISKTGITKLGMRNATDIDDSPPSLAGGTAYCQIIVRCAEYTGTDYDPKLVVNYTAGGGSTFIPQIMNS